MSNLLLSLPLLNCPFDKMRHTSAKGCTVSVGRLLVVYRLANPQKAKKCDNLNQSWESSEKWVKSRERFQWRLWVLEVTISLKAGAVNMTINFQFRFCKFCVLLAPS